MINVHNKDGKYFEFSILAALYHNQIPRTHTSRSYHYKNHLGTRLKGCKEPMKIEDIPKFEKQNHIPICVYRIKWNGEEVFLLYITKNRDQDPINLLLIEGEEHYHFTWIKNLNKLLSDPIYPDTKVFCPYCCYRFGKKRNGKRSLTQHKIYCRPYGAQRTKFLPIGENIIKFNYHSKMQRPPFCIYADFETINKRIEITKLIDEDENSNPMKCGTELKMNHKVSGFTFHRVSPYFP